MWMLKFIADLLLIKIYIKPSKYSRIEIDNICLSIKDVVNPRIKKLCQKCDFDTP